MRLARLTFAVLLVVAAPAGASEHSNTLVINDPAGDANFINNGGEFSIGNTPTPAGQPQLDLRRVRLAPSLNSTQKVFTGFSVTLDLEAPVADRTQLTLKTRTANCADILLQFVQQDGRSHAQLVSGCSTDVLPVDVRVDDERVVMTVLFDDLPTTALNDGVLQTVNVFSQVHVGRFSTRNVGSTMADTTLDRATYRLR